MSITRYVICVLLAFAAAIALAISWEFMALQLSLTMLVVCADAIVCAIRERQP